MTNHQANPQAVGERIILLSARAPGKIAGWCGKYFKDWRAPRTMRLRTGVDRL